MPVLTALLIALSSLSTVTAQVRTGEPPRERYVSAAIDTNGDLVIVTAGGQTVVIRKEREQTAFSAPVISSARTAVAAQAMFANCCTSYDIPLQLVVYAGGRTHRFGGGWPVFEWGFADGGTRIAYGQQPVHSGCAVFYELRDIDAERLIDKASVPQPCGQFPDPKPVEVPGWVKRLISMR